MSHKVAIIESIRYGTLVSEEWLQYSVAEINKPSLKGSPNKDRHATPYDKRMGILENTKEPCSTCQRTNMDCPGHFGHIILPFPIWNKLYMPFILLILKSFCIECARPRILPRHAEMQGFLKKKGIKCLKYFATQAQKAVVCPWEGCCDKNIIIKCKKCKNSSSNKKCKKCKRVCEKCNDCVSKRCKGCNDCNGCKDCGAILSNFNYKDGEVKQILGKEEPVLFKAGEAYNVFMRITNEHLQVVGFNRTLPPLSIKYRYGNKTHPLQFRPESMIWTVFPCIPPRARPYCIRDGEKHDDDITDILNSVIKCCNKLSIDDSGDGVPHSRSRRKIALKEEEREKVSENLRKGVWSIVDNQDQASKLSTGGRAHKGLFTRIQGKKGRVQLNNAATRSDFTSRTVIVGGGVELKANELGVPRYIAEILTRPHKAKAWNIAHLQAQVDSGRVNSILRDGHVVRLKGAKLNTTRTIQVQENDIVECQLKDGDKVPFNRQPSLRKESFIGFNAKIIDDIYAWRVNLSATPGFNADFDGDEMNGHFVQSMSAYSEVSVLMRSEVNIVTPQTNSPIAGIVQDGLTGAYILTNTWVEGGPADTFVDRDTFMDVLMNAEIGLDRYEDLLTRAASYYPDYISECGDSFQIASQIPGKLAASILFPRDFCYERTVEIDKGVDVTVKITDGVMHSDSGPLFKKIIGGKSSSVIHKLWKNYSPEIASRFLTDTQRFIDYWFHKHGFSFGVSDCVSHAKTDVMKEMTKIKATVAGMLIDEYTPKLETEINNVLNSANNIGPRIAKPAMNKGERNALNIMRLSGGKGSPVNLSGIVATVGGQNMDAARIPLYLSNGTRSLPIYEKGDNSSEARGYVFSSYMDGLTPGETVFHAMSGREGIISTAVKTSESGYIQKKVSKKLEDYKFLADGTVRDANNCIIQFMYGDDGMDAAKILNAGGRYPFFAHLQDVANMLNSKVRNSGRTPTKHRRLHKDEIDLLVSFIVAGSPGIQTPVTEKCTENMRTELRKLVKKVKIYESEIPEFCVSVRNMFESSKSQYGDMVGLIASLSIGEPTTQMILNVFHLAGCGEKDVSVGVPRFKEIMNATSDPKKPGCVIYFNSDQLSKKVKRIQKYEKKKLGKTEDVILKLEESSKKVKKECLEYLQTRKKEFEYTLVDTFYESYEMKYIHGDVDPVHGMSPIDVVKYKEYTEEWWVTLAKQLRRDEYSDIDPESWVLIMHFNIEKMFEKKVMLSEIAKAIETHSEDHLRCIPSPNCIGKIEIHLNYREIKEYVSKNLDIDQMNSDVRRLMTDENVNYFTCREIALKVARDAPISGIAGISTTFAREDIKTKEWVLDTRGTNLLNILSMKGVDSHKTVSDDMWEIYNVLGIQAARTFLIEELIRIISFDGTYVNPRHIEILVDSMTYTGTITSVRRDGISRDVGPIAKIMFEKTIVNGIHASAFTEEDTMDSVSAAVMYGKEAKCGTGLVNVRSVRAAPTQTINIMTDENTEEMDSIEEIMIKAKKSKSSKSSKSTKSEYKDKKARRKTRVSH